MLRMPLHPVAIELLREVGPMAVSSANISGRPAATTAEEAQHQLGDLVDVYLDAGPSGAGRLDDRRPHRSGAADPAGGPDQHAGRRRCAGHRRGLAERLTGPPSQVGAVPFSAMVSQTDVLAWSASRAAAMLPTERVLALADRGAGVPLRELVLVGLTAAIVTYFATGWVRVLATRLGAVAYPRERDVHLHPTPRMGGLAMYVGVIAAVFLASQLPALTRGFIYSSGMPAVVVAGGLIMGIGLIDDRWGLDALTKFAGQITAASVLVTMGVAWVCSTSRSAGSAPSCSTRCLDPADPGLTVSIVNAMNFVDGLDGLAAGSV